MKLTNNDIINISKYSQLSYYTNDKLNSKHNIRPYNKNSCEESLYYVNNIPKLYHFDNDCQLIILEYNNSLIISFRGTESKEDIFIDLNIFKKKIYLKENNFKNPYIHSGFLKQFEGTKNFLKSQIKNYDTIIFCGHSLGGALASIASLYFSFYYRNKKFKCVTFGSPRAGDKQFSKLFKKNIEESLRFVNDYDPIPSLPSSIRFKHVNGLCWLKKKDIVNEISIWRFYYFLKSSLFYYTGYSDYNAIKDHSCKEYVKDIINYYSN